MYQALYFFYFVLPSLLCFCRFGFGRRFVPSRLFRTGITPSHWFSVAARSAHHMFSFLISCFLLRSIYFIVLLFLPFFFVDLDLGVDLFYPAIFLAGIMPSHWFSVATR